MNKEEKAKAVEELKGQLADYKSIYLTDIAGLNAVQTSKLRRECFNYNVKLSVVKNTFLERAMSESENEFGERGYIYLSFCSFFIKLFMIFFSDYFILVFFNAFY